MSNRSLAAATSPVKFLLALAVAGLSLVAIGTLTQAAEPDPPDERALLLAPKALPQVPPRTAEQLRGSFADPPAEYRSMPLWVWNDELQWPRLKQQLADFKKQGMGGVFVHPRPGLMTEYLGPEWFRLWSLSLDEGKRLGMLVNIYDENSYPAGFAGGHVPSRAPDTAAQYVQAEMDADPSRLRIRRAVSVAAFAVEKTPSGELRSVKRIEDASEIPKDHSLVVFRLRRASGNPWTGGFPYVDLTNPETARTFIETTFEAYREFVGEEFGRAIRWVFDDEPLIATGGAYDKTDLALPLSYNTLAEFQRRNGYDLADHLPSLFWDVGKFRQVRFDYWQTLHDVWKENYFRPLFLWCDRNNLQFTGHWMEHEWPYPWITPADASLYAYEHVPGIDMLEGSKIRTEGVDPHMLFTIKQVASVSHQLGRRAFCEAYGVAGWDSTFEHYKRFGDWLMVHGINFMNQHLSFATVRGARKRDHPQSFSDVSAWWPYYKLHGDHLGRVSYLLSQGQARNRVLVLQPTTSGFLWARRGADTPELAKMREENGDLNQFLADRQVDFDLGDEYILEWFGRQQGKQMVVGRAAYDLLVWPKNMINLRQQTLPLLEAYLAAGGELLALSEPAAYVDGRENVAVKTLREKYASQWHSVPNLDALLGEIGRRLEPRVRLETTVPPGVGFSERFLQDGDRVLFFANTGLQAVRTHATVEGACLERWDTVAGETSPARFEAVNPGRVRFDLNLAPAGSQMFVAKKTACPPAAPAEVRYSRLELGAWTVEADAPNVLVLDYCDLKSGGVELRDTNTWKANWTAWELHGFERPAWDNAVQFKNRIFDRNRFPASSGFEATFRFTVADAAALPGLRLALEAPELYQVSVNGQKVSFDAASPWLDPHLRSVPIDTAARSGENVVKVVGQPFDVRMELENIYILGKFAVAAGPKGFRLAARGPLDFGSWKKQGYPFYGASMLYSTKLTVPAGKDRLQISLGAWEGSVAEVLLDGKPVALLGWQPHTAEFAAAPGERNVALRVVSTPRNVLGPFHNPTKPRMRAWPAAWAEFPNAQPPGDQYDLLDYGLMARPSIGAGSSQGAR